MPRFVDDHQESEAEDSQQQVRQIKTSHLLGILTAVADVRTPSIGPRAHAERGKEGLHVRKGREI
jgi:hypothetical protein